MVKAKKCSKRLRVLAAGQLESVSGGLTRVTHHMVATNHSQPKKR